LFSYLLSPLQEVPAMRSICLVALVGSASAYSKGYVRQPHDKPYPTLPLSAINMAAPSRVDWSVNATTAIKDQGRCGSCWAFSTTEGVESAIFMATGKLPQALSTEELVSCDKGSDLGCNGGDLPTALKYLEKNGVASAADYPDHSSKNGRTTKCEWDKKTVAKVSSFTYALPACEKGDCSNQNEETLAAALAQYGPISICVNAGPFNSYNGGVLKEKCSAKANKIDHCVQLVGYDKSPSNGEEAYWKIRNSWGKSYGEDGFIRIPYGKDNACCVACEAVIISAKPL